MWIAAPPPGVSIEKAHNGAGYDKCPERSHRVGFDGLQHRHVMLCILGLNGIGLEVCDGRLLGEDDVLLHLLGMAVGFGLDVEIATHGGQ